MHSAAGTNTVDMVHGPVFKSLIRFSVPIMLSILFQQLYNLVDTMIVAHYLGDSALAAMGATTAIFDTLIGFALGMGSGLTLITSRCYGANHLDTMKQSVAGSLYIGIITSAVITAVGLAFMPSLLHILNTPADILKDSLQYISTIVAFTFVMFLYNLLSSLLRAIGNSFMDLIFLILASVLNILLDLLFVTRFHMGIRGAAIATVIAQGISALLCLIYILKRARILIPQSYHFRFNGKLYWDMATQGLAMGFMQSIVAVGTVILQSGINTFGTLIIAGHTTARKIYMLFIVPFGGIGQSMATFVSQNYGAERRDRIQEAMRASFLFNALMAAGVSLLLFLTAPMLVRLVSGSGDPTLVHNASLYLYVVGPFYFVLGAVNSLRNSLQSLGDKLNPILSSVTELLIKVLFVLFLIPRMGYFSVIICEPLIWSVMAIQLYLLYKRTPFMRGA